MAGGHARENRSFLLPIIDSEACPQKGHFLEKPARLLFQTAPQTLEYLLRNCTMHPPPGWYP